MKTLSRQVLRFISEQDNEYNVFTSFRMIKNKFKLPDDDLGVVLRELLDRRYGEYDEYPSTQAYVITQAGVRMLNR